MKPITASVLDNWEITRKKEYIIFLCFSEIVFVNFYHDWMSSARRLEQRHYRGAICLPADKDLDIWQLIMFPLKTHFARWEKNKNLLGYINHKTS